MSNGKNAKTRWRKKTIGGNSIITTVGVYLIINFLFVIATPLS